MMDPDAHALSTPRSEDAAADRRTFYWAMAFIATTLLVVILSSATEIERSGRDYPIGRVILNEVTGFGAMLVMFALIARLVSLATPGQHSWQRVIPVHIAGSVLVGFLHISLFVLIRSVLTPTFFSVDYDFSEGNLVREIVYEFRKSALAYTGLVFAITFGRQLDQQRRELDAARENARQSSKITLKCGGRTILLAGSDVVWAQAASNYVEVHTAQGSHLARATLTSIERQLVDAGVPAIRVHRSYVVNADQIEQIEPTGEGDVTITLKGNSQIPGSRRYRDRLPAG